MNIMNIMLLTILLAGPVLHGGAGDHVHVGGSTKGIVMTGSSSPVKGIVMTGSPSPVKGK